MNNYYTLLINNLNFIEAVIFYPNSRLSIDLLTQKLANAIHYFLPLIILPVIISIISKVLKGNIILPLKMIGLFPIVKSLKSLKYCNQVTF